MRIPVWLLIPLCATVGNGGPFESATAFPMTPLTAAPASGAIEDFDGDGHGDLAAANGPSLSVYRGSAAGFSPAPWVLTLGTTQPAIAAGHLNGDAFLDLAVTSFDDNTVVILAGAGDGTFSVGNSYGTGAGPRDIATGDFNSDGKSDLAVADYTAGTVSILTGNGNGTFQAATPLAVGAYASSLVVGHFNPGSHLDVAVLTGSNVTFFWGGGDGTFTAGPSAVAPGAVSLSAADFNGDGRTDLATGCGVYSGWNVTVLWGLGNGTFSTGALGVSGGVGSGDLNGDGRSDIVVLDYSRHIASVHLGQTNNTFVRGMETPAGTNAFWGSSSDSVLVAEVVEGGGPDVVALTTGEVLALPSTVTVISGSGDGTLRGARCYDHCKPVAIVGDFDSNGRDDVAMPEGILMCGTDGIFELIPGLAPPPGSFLVSGTAADFDGDGNLDAAFAGQKSFSGTFTPSAVVMLGNGDGTFKPYSLHSVPDTFPLSIAAGDLNGDGATDLALGIDGDSTRPGLSILLGRGDGTFLNPIHYPVARRFQDVVIADLSGDGRMDAAAACLDTEEYDQTGATVLLGLEDGTLTGPVSHGTSGFSLEHIRAADLNADGHLDLVAGGSISGATRTCVLLGKGDGAFHPAVAYIGATGKGMDIGDVTGDGIADIVGGRYNWDSLGLLIGRGDGTFEAFQSFPSGLHPYRVLTGNFNGDNADDVVVMSEVATTVFLTHSPTASADWQLFE